MSNEITLAKKLKLPSNAVTQKFAFVARSGAGKTYAAGRLTEEMHRIGNQFIVLDPVGVWYGLRIAADGEGPGIPVPVFGGNHADVPIAPTHGKALAELLVNQRLSAVIDCSLMRKNQRNAFITEFVREFYHLKKLHKGPVHVLIEEAHTFIPQRTGPDTAQMLGAFEDMCRLGRNFGIGWSVITQRPQAVNKDVLNQIECLVALQTTGTHERKAIKEWVVDKGGKENLVDELPGLEIGEAFIWSPQWLKILAKYKIAKKSTYDASATPEFDEAMVPAKSFAQIDLTALRDAFEATIEEAGKDDPKLLKKRVQELEKVNSKLAAELAEMKTVRQINVPFVTEQDVQLMQKVHKVLTLAIDKANDIGTVHVQPIESAPVAPAPKPKKIIPLTRPQLVRQHKTTKTELKKGAVSLLQALAQLGKPLTRAQLSMCVGIRSRGSTFSSYLSMLRTSGYIDETGDNISISTTGRRHLEAIGMYPTQVVTHEAIVALWRSKLKKGACDMLDVLIAEYPEEIHRETLAEVVGIDPQGSTFSSYLSSLRVCGLLADDHSGKMVKATSDLWPQGVSV